MWSALLGSRERDFQQLNYVMNNLVLTKKRLLKAERLHKAQLATFKKGVFTSYKPSVFVDRKKVVREDFSAVDS